MTPGDAMHNVELKAELRDPALARTILSAIGATRILAFDQVDTYFRIPHGRLKRRETTGEPVEYIVYERPNRAAPKLSNFTIFTAQQALDRFGYEPLPTWLMVRKHRELWMHGGVRIHLDRVEKLGDFLEFEALVGRTQNMAKCHQAIAMLRERLRPVMGELIDCGYSDLLARELDENAPIGPKALPPGSHA